MRRAADTPARLNAPPMTVALVACVRMKARAANPAKDLYTSEWFVKARRYAERRADRWYILSARHGLVSPDRIIEPCDYTLFGQRRYDRRFWGQNVARKLIATLPPRSTSIIPAGEVYREFLVLQLAQQQFAIEIPMRGLAIGKQLAFLKKETAS